jgi:hypothetical protein
LASQAATKLPPGAPAQGASLFVGRDDELQQIVAVCQSAPAMVLVEGEPGIGKTLLIDEAVAAPSLRRTLSFHFCQPYRALTLSTCGTTTATTDADGASRAEVAQGRNAATERQAPVRL